jgi:hypothetical protein
MRWLDERFPNSPRSYVDAGAFHPLHCSNTLLLKKQGWWGVNIDMAAGKVEQFGGLTDRLAAQVDARSLAGAQEPINNMVAVTTTLDAVLAAAPRKIDRIGYRDLEVLKGFDLAKYSPDVITIEAFPDQVDQTVEYLTGMGYERKEQLHLTSLFVREVA